MIAMIVFTFGFGFGNQPTLGASPPNNEKGSAKGVRIADYEKAEAFFNSGEYAKCIGYASQAIEDGEYGERWHLIKIRALMTTGRYADALVALDEALPVYSRSLHLRWVGMDVALFNNDVTKSRELASEFEELKARTWRYRDAENQVIISKYELKKGVDPKRVLNDRLNPIGSTNVSAQMTIAQLGIEKGDFALAAENFLAASKLDPTNPDIFFGIAQAFESSDAKKTNEAIGKVLELNPDHVPTLLRIAENRIDEENYEQAETQLKKILEINPAHPTAFALRAVVAHLTNRVRDESWFRLAALKPWKGNPHVDHLIGKKLSQKYRFAEGAVYQKRALMYDSDYAPAKMQLTQDLLRLGEELEGWKLADEVYGEDGYNVVAHNLVTLRSNITRFATLERDGFVVRMDPRESRIYGDQVMRLLVEAKSLLQKKYSIEIEEPIYVEIFPKQQDFAIRTFGLPGGAGYLGVCFGKVITMNSPASQGDTPTNWQSVLWHEFCHVITLQKTKNKMPRWLSEGISVYEERLKDPTWGQSMSNRYREMILSDDLTPVSRLSGAFLQPKSAEHLQFAYFESSLVVEYLIDKYGLDTLKRVLDDLGIGLTANESLARYAGSIKLLDKEFEEYARKLARGYAPGVEFDLGVLKENADLLESAGGMQQLAAKYPSHYVIGIQYAKQLVETEQWQEAIRELDRLIELHPSTSTAFELRAQAARGANDIEIERASLEKLVGLVSDNFSARLRLAEIAASESNWGNVLLHAKEATAINPLLAEPHRYLALAGEKTGAVDVSASAWSAVLEMNPLDPAEAYFRLATSQYQLNDLTAAKLSVLKSLENAPRFKAALELLLEINQKFSGDGNTDSGNSQSEKSKKGGG